MSDEIIPTFHGEMQLAGWAETHTGGCKVTFWLPDPADLDAFRALTVRKGNVAGHRFMVAMVEIGDDEQPVQPPPATPAEPEQPKGGALAKLAGQWCAQQDFWLFLRANGATCDNCNDAANIVRRVCKIPTRAQLDHDEAAAQIFERRFRRPFMEWQGARR